MASKKSVFDYIDYKSFLDSHLGDQSQRSGARTKLSQLMEVQTTYLSQILRGNSHLSLEQAYRAGDYFHFNESERAYFLLLVQWARAGSPALRQHFRREIDRCRDEHLSVKNRVKPGEVLKPEQQLTYYSSWHYGAIHMALTVKSLFLPEAMSEHFGIPVARVIEVLHFLEAAGMARRDGLGYRAGLMHMHLGDNSSHISRHHINWRTQAMVSLDRNHGQDLHYSALYTLSQADVRELRERLVSMIAENLKTIEPSPEEVIYCCNIDFFDLKAKA